MRIANFLSRRKAFEFKSANPKSEFRNPKFRLWLVINHYLEGEFKS